ncbi:MAG TPA: c-type cytochrome [Thermomicrobiales bacterium]|nr:c-type cytochrome [Thermomicrobiales bacterium]
MGAVQKLATVVIIGLVALATVLTVYIAREPDRRDEELTEQEQLSIQRGTDLYITYCLQCHGPAGLGATGGEDPPRIGPPLATDFYQSDDPIQQQEAENLIRYRVTYGADADPRVTEKVMPAFGQDLSGEQINDLVFLILNGDWSYVYNQSVLQTGLQVAQQDCEAEGGDTEHCEHLEEGSEEAPPLYPTSPPQEEANPSDEGEEAEEESADTESADVAVALEALDPYDWSESDLTVKPGDTISVVNSGTLQHDFTVDELSISEDLPTDGSEVLITIPEDAEPGEYEFYCSVPGHREGGMYGTLVIEAP